MSKMQGFVKFPRELTTLGIFKHQFDFRLLMLIITHATFKDEYEYDNFTLKKGQYLRSYRKLSDDLIYVENKKEIKPSLKQIQNSVRRLTEYGFLSVKHSQQGTLFSLSESLINQCFEPIEDENRIHNRIHLNGVTEYKKKNGVFKKNGLKKNDLKTSSSFHDCFYLNYGKQLNAIQLQELIAYLDQDGIEEEMLKYAIEYSAIRSSNFPYLKAVLNNWIAKGIKTRDDAITDTKSRGGENGETETVKKPYHDLNW